MPQMSRPYGKLEEGIRGLEGHACFLSQQNIRSKNVTKRNLLKRNHELQVIYWLHFSGFIDKCNINFASFYSVGGIAVNIYYET